MDIEIEISKTRELDALNQVGEKTRECIWDAVRLTSTLLVAPDTTEIIVTERKRERMSQVGEKQKMTAEATKKERNDQ